MQKTKMKLKSNRHFIKKRKGNLNSCNKMQSTENSQNLKSDLKEKTLRIISEVQNCNTNDIIEENLSTSEPENESDAIFDIIKPLHYCKDDTLSTRNNINSILYSKIMRFVVCIVILFTYIYNLLSIHNELQLNGN